jgi:hypothetical protein
MHRTFFVFGEVFDMIKLISVTICWYAVADGIQEQNPGMAAEEVALAVKRAISLVADNPKLFKDKQVKTMFAGGSGAASMARIAAGEALPLLGEKAAYVFYTPLENNWRKEALDARKTFMKVYGLSEEDVLLLAIRGNKDFEAGWNAMGASSIVNSTVIKGVAVNAHGSPERISNNGAFAFGAGDITNLSNKNINALYLYACNAGHLDYRDTNPAAQFARVINGAPVVASDGTVESWLFYNYKSVGDFVFQNLVKSATPGVNRVNEGWLTYREVSGRISVTNSIYDSKSLSLNDMIVMAELLKDRWRLNVTGNTGAKRSLDFPY